MAIQRGHTDRGSGRARFLTPLRALVWALLFTACGQDRVVGYRVVAEHDHDPRAYTQGFLWHDGFFYESTGRYGTSSVRRVTPETGKVEARHDLPSHLFGEGLAVYGDRLVQLTWKAHTARVYDLASLAPLKEFTYETEGWGLTSDGTHLIVSDGTNLLSFRDPETFEEKRRVRVKEGQLPIDQLNELEYVEGQIWANVWKSDMIARIDPEDGQVVGWIDLTGLFDHRSIPDQDAVLNGIAYDPKSRHIFVTGKLWPKVFQIELAPKKGD